MRIIAEFSKNKGLESNIEFLKEIYHGGYGIKGEIDDFSAWYAEDGIHINRGATARFSENAQVYSWEEIADKITDMLDNGAFATNVELTEAPDFEQRQIAEKLWNLYHDLSDEAREYGYLSPLHREKFLGFPEERDDIADKLQDNSFREAIATELASLINDYENDKSLIRFKFHKPKELLERVRELDLPRTVYLMPNEEMPEVVSFITDDEINESLRGGGNVAGGRGRIYDFFTENHTQQEKIKFLKEEYGIGGHSHALSDSDGSFEDYSGKGISFRKGDCTEIQMSWNNVAKRITELIRADRYFTPEAKRQYEAAKRRKQFDGLYGEYNAVKEAHPSDMVLFQVGDFFEMFGEDAKAAGNILDIQLTGRTVENVGRVDMCGFPSFMLEDNVEKLRDKYDVTISAIDAKTEKRGVYTLLSVDREAEHAIDEQEAEHGADGTRVFRDDEAEQAQTAVEKSLAQYKPIITAAITDDVAYRNACGHSDHENAVVEGNAAIRRAILNSGNIELIRQYSDVPEFRHRLHQEVIDETYTQLHELLRPLSQDDIENAIRAWNGNTESKRRVNEYMVQHGRERGASTWLANEYGGSENNNLLVARAGTPEESKLPWTTVQRTLIQMIAEDTFLTDDDRTIEDEPLKFEEMTDEDKEDFVQAIDMTRDYGEDISEEEADLYNRIIEERTQQSEALEATPEQETVSAIPETSPEQEPVTEVSDAVNEQEPVPEAEDYSRFIGREIEVDDRRFVVEHINDLFHTVELKDITFQNGTGFPIFRSESLEWLKRVMDLQEHSNEPVAAETVAVYPAEENNLPYDIVIERIPADAPSPEVGNFRITDEHLGEGGAKAKFRANMNAINLLKELEFDGRQATEEEQEILSKYVGWGSLPDAFDESKEAWADEFQELYTALSPDEYKAAKASVLNAHYTSPTVIRAVYEAIENMGFTKGNILEPSMGVGNFFGLLPESMSGSNLYGVELDNITGKIAKQLYPKADITVAGFETTDRRDFYDLAVGNVPFGQYQVSDKAYNKLGFPIHDYFIAKAIDQVRPGGVIAFVTSRYTLDKQSPEARQYFAKRAELLGAIRLPNTAFKANAGTEVVSDIIFLQKRDSPIEIEPDWSGRSANASLLDHASWVHLGQNADGYAINSYFIDHPDMVLGRQTSESTQYGRQDFTVVPYEGTDLSEQLKEAITKIGGMYKEAEIGDDIGDEQTTDTLPADPNVKNYSYTLVDGEVYYRRNSVMVKPDVNTTALQRIKGMIELRDCVNELIEKQMDADMPGSAIKETQGRLNTLYDNYVAKYGIINSRANSLAFSYDSSYYLLCSLENVDEDKQHATKADMFTKRTIKPHKVVTSVDTASEALAISIGEKAKIDMEFMSSLTGKAEQELFSELKGVIFLNPEHISENDGRSKYLTADEYLSGNVREKLELAKRSAEVYPDDYNINVEALKSAQPKDLDASEIEVRLGATWIDKEYIKEFMWETFDMPYYLQRSIEVNYSPYTAEWNITNKNMASHNDVNVYMTYGTERANAFKILEETLNLRDVRIYDTKTDADGTERRVLNSKETTLAQQKQQAIKDEFRDWIWRDVNRRQELVERYNTLFNSTRPREYDGSHITFSGMNPEITLREHQLNAVAHILYGGNTLLAHEVGAGKTFEMVAAAMESKRLGLCQKALFVVPNHLTEQWASEFLRLYPSANILAATKKDFEPHNRKKFCARIATGDYDAVIIGHSQFERIPVSKERQERLIEEQIEELEQGLEELKSSRAERFTIKSVERTKRGLEARLKKLQDNDRKDDVITFEQLGVDRLFVDEAHAFKNLFLYTKMRNVAELSTSDAQKSSDMYLKCRYIDEMTDSKGVVFATGTPVSNSMTELYTMMRYLQHDTIQKKGLTHFDCWASTFGETTTAIELAPEGTGYRARTRFSKFFNLPELMNLFKEAADIKTSDQLNLPTPTAVYHNVVAQPTEIQKSMVQELSERAAKVHSGAVDASVDNMLKITSDGRKLGLDQRIINPELPDEPQSKVNMCVDNIYKIWEDGKSDKLTQLVFCDLSTPKNVQTTRRAAKAVSGNIDSPEIHALEQLNDAEETKEFTVYDDICDKLVGRGIPREEIAFIHEANTEVRKKELYAKVRSGQVRVLMGSTFKMGAGMNVQDRLVALHDLDCPWRPGDLEQRSGRIIRQGNKNEEVHIYRYVTEATFDAYLWQTIENKQKFISQIMTSKSPVRSCEDIDETALSYAEIKALCAGDERIKEKMDLDIDVARLKLMKANHQSQQYRLEDNLLKHFPEQIEQNKGYIEGFKEDMKTLEQHPHPQDGFAGMTVRNDYLTDKENAGAALVDAFKEVKGLDLVEIGSYRGFNMYLSLEDFGKEYVLTLKGKMTHRVTLGKDPRGNLVRIENAFNNIEKRLETVKERLDALYIQVENAKAELGKPFPQEEELKVKSARLAELNTELNIDDRTPMEQAVDTAADERDEVPQIAKSEKPSLLAKLQIPLPDNKTVETKNNELEGR
ncbi:MAG: SNF2-related protein [bacterium]|nr:SNF2-related protein [bacterium]